MLGLELELEPVPGLGQALELALEQVPEQVLEQVPEPGRVPHSQQLLTRSPMPLP